MSYRPLIENFVSHLKLIRHGFKAFAAASAIVLACAFIAAGFAPSMLCDGPRLVERMGALSSPGSSVLPLEAGNDTSVSLIHQYLVTAPRVLNLFSSRVSLRGQASGFLSSYVHIHNQRKTNRGVAHIDAPDLLNTQTTNLPLLI